MINFTEIKPSASEIKNIANINTLKKIDMKTKTLIIGFLFGIMSLTVFSQTNAKTSFKYPKSVGYVNDFEKIFTKDQINELNGIITKHEKKTTNEIAIVSITSYKPYDTLFDYSLGLANAWGVGKKDKNNGIVIVFGKQIKQIRIQVGNGLQNKLSDKETKKIIENTIIPEFKKGEFYAGIKNGLIEIINEIN